MAAVRRRYRRFEMAHCTEVVLSEREQKEFGLFVPALGWAWLGRTDGGLFAGKAPERRRHPSSVKESSYFTQECDR